MMIAYEPTPFNYQCTMKSSLPFELKLKQNIITIKTTTEFMSNKSITLLNAATHKYNTEKSTTVIEEIHIDIKSTLQICYFFIGSMIVISNKIQPKHFVIKNIRPPILSSLMDLGINKIFTLCKV